MKNKSCGLIVMLMLACSVTSSEAQLSIGIGLPNVSIGINLPFYPQLSPVPGYPVYYAPGVNANYFFYDGMYWVYQDDNWYASSWYNGPWGGVDPDTVPLYVLRIPVRYYQQPPVYFRGWQTNAPPRWGQHWGNGWEQRRSGWNRWNRKAAPERAPLPVYQRQYSGDRYPHADRQHALRNQSYRYQPRDKTVRQHLRQQTEQRTPAQRGMREEPQMRSQGRQAPHQQSAPTDLRSQPQQRDEHVQKPAPDHSPQQRGQSFRDQRQQPHDVQREQQNPEARDQQQRPQDRGESRDSGRGHGQNKDDERGRGRKD